MKHHLSVKIQNAIPEVSRSLGGTGTFPETEEEKEEDDRHELR